ncbi:uncharacterized protein JCM15063_002018 [Sporobolomyces koalae]|uniref:uncharacterized protein n=1 Tax=Sporobolomyces koalae TaxID=500713 RepID=UPI0031824C16
MTVAAPSIDGQRFVAWLPTAIHPAALHLAHELFDVIDSNDPRSDKWYETAHAAIVTSGKLSKEHVERANHLRIVTRNGVGTDSVPLDTCRQKSIVVTNQPGCNAQAVAEIALGLAIAVRRKLCQIDRTLRSGQKTISADWRAQTVQGQTVGLIGMGDIARETAKKFIGAFECPILVYSPTSSKDKWTASDPSRLAPIAHRRVDTLEELLQMADIVSLHCPKNDETTGLIGARQFELMKKSAVILNTARGGLIDEQALVQAIKNGEIGGAGIDTLEHEPPTLERYRELLTLDQVVVLPHVGAQDETSQRQACLVAVESAYSYLTGHGIGQSTRVV